MQLVEKTHDEEVAERLKKRKEVAVPDRGVTVVNEDNSEKEGKQNKKKTPKKKKGWMGG